ncbi:hypothetical protein IV102_12860 [bacterium]|nr:hypothetical protein [bacterium]
MPESPAPELGEQVIARILLRRMHDEQSLIAGEREAVSYRVAELMVSAKDLYSQYLPRLLKEVESQHTLEDEISGLRMALLHLRDLVTDFDNAFLEAMYSERKANPEMVYDPWKNSEQEDEWTAEDLGLSEEEMEE